MITISVALLAALLLLVIEAYLVNQSVISIKNRIHVNGTRGKSTVTEYITAALSQPGEETIGKITGVIPTLIMNNTRTTIHRSGGVRIQEQFDIIRAAARQKCSNLVLECMSIDPVLQKTESKFFKPQIYIITNLRDDHREISGTGPNSLIEGICDAIPPGSTVITAEERYFDKISESADKKGCRVIKAGNTISDNRNGAEVNESLIGENLALTLATCNLLEIDPQIATDRIYNFISSQKPRLNAISGGKEFMFLNGFDVNDTNSAGIFLDHWLSKIEGINNLIILFNTRSDRPVRTKLFAEWIPGVPNLSHIIVSGNHRKKAINLLLAESLKKEQISELKEKDVIHVKHIISDLAERNTLVIGLGNITGTGFKILDILE